jgi:predicted O-methyltransferase YrrM
MLSLTHTKALSILLKIVQEVKLTYAVFGIGSFGKELIKKIATLQLPGPEFIIDQSCTFSSYQDIKVIQNLKGEPTQVNFILLGSDTHQIQMCEFLNSSVYAGKVIDLNLFDSSTFEESVTSWKPIGHFYSPIGRVEELSKNPARKSMTGVNLNTERQLQELQSFNRFAEDFLLYLKYEENLYTPDNGGYGFADAMILFSMIRKYCPKKIIEVGSGYSSTLILDVNQKYFDNKIELNFIEPFPNKLKELCSKEILKQILIEEKVQDVTIECITDLNEDDILFIDSTHVSRTQSDVNYLFFEILPRLRKGVIVHIHDIFYPFEYPEKWIKQGRWWNEIYLLQAFLIGNQNFEILFFSDYLRKEFSEDISKNLSGEWQGRPGSFWMVKK